MLQWEWLGGLPPLRRAAVIGGGSWGTAIAVMLARAGHRRRPRLPHPRAGRADRGDARSTSATSPASSCPSACTPVRAADLELVPPRPRRLRRPRRRAARRGRRARRARSAPRAGVLVLTKGLVPPLGTLPERLRRRAHARLRGRRARRAGPRRRARSTTAPRSCSPPRPGVRAPGLRRACRRRPAGQPHGRRRRRRARGLRQERRRARRGRRRRRRAERRRRRRRQGVRRDRRLRAPRRAHSPRRSPASPARATSSPPCWPRARATAAPASCSARACRPTQIAPRSARPRGGRSVPLLAARLKHAGVDAPVLNGLAGIIEGRVEAARWTASLTAPQPASAAGRRKAASGGSVRARMDAAPDKAKLDADFSALYKAHLQRRLLVLVLPRGQPPRRRGPDRADVPAGLPALRARAEGVRGAPAAAVADPHRPQPGGELLPRPLAPAADQHRRRGRDLDAAHHRGAGARTATTWRGSCAASQQLPDDRREALIMRFALDMDNREIARALGRTDGATKVLIHRAIRQLEEIVQADANGDGSRDVSPQRARGHRGPPARRAAPRRPAGGAPGARRAHARLARRAGGRRARGAGSWRRCATRATGRAPRRPAAAVVVGPAPRLGLVVLRTQRKRHSRRAQSHGVRDLAARTLRDAGARGAQGLRRIGARPLIRTGPRRERQSRRWTCARSPTRT